MESELSDFLSLFITDRRRGLIDSHIEQRTRYISVLLEDIYQSHNASAVLRTCDCFGIQDVHIIESRNRYSINPDVELGAAQWLTLKRYNTQQDNITAAIHFLKKQGYRIAATVPSIKATPLEQFDIKKGPVVCCFGTELSGLTPTAIKLADAFITIPMYGFTESFNISVSAAIILYHLTMVMRQSEVQWRLTENEKEELRLEWIKNSLTDADGLIREFERRKRQGESICKK